MEVYNYQHCYAHETDERIRLIWDELLDMELEHLQLWGQLTVEFRFEENKSYIRKVLGQQIDLRQWGGQWLPKDELPADWPSHRMVEQCGWQLYRVLGERASDSELRERYEEFGRDRPAPHHPDRADP